MLGKFNLANLYKYFFYLFIFFIPLQTRKVFLTDYSFYTGSFTEFGSFYIYLSDILFALALASLCLFNRKLVKDGFIKLKDKSVKPQIKNIFLALICLVIWFFISSLVNYNFIELSLFRSVKMTEMFFLIMFVYITFSNKLFFATSLLIVVLAGFFQGIIAIYQFIYQHSLFISPLWHKLLGETTLSPYLPGIAKITSDGSNIVRAYGTFPHPNILGGFLIFSIFISLCLYLCHENDSMSSFVIRKPKSSFQTSTTIFWIIIFTSQFLGLILSFSRSAWLALFISSILYLLFYLKFEHFVSRETITSLVFVKHRGLSISLLIVVIIILSNTNVFSNRVQQNIHTTPKEITSLLPQNDTFNDRYFFNNVSRETLSRSPFFGSGPGTSTFQINRYLIQQGRATGLEPWQYQPAHNIFILSASETGVIGFLIFAYIILQTISLGVDTIVSRETIPSKRLFMLSSLAVLLGFIIIGQFDHYLWTLQQGQLIFWFTIGVLLL